jgi:hypothetical protein
MRDVDTIILENLYNKILNRDEIISEDSQDLVNILQTALDIAGLEPTIGTGADALNSIISGLRAASSKTSDEKNKHLINAGISAISMIPLGDVAKFLKYRPTKKLTVNGR